MIFEDSKTRFYIDGYLKDNLDIAKKVVEKDWDMVFLVDGIEGSGKSVLAMQCAYFCDNTITLDRITFTPDEFKAAIDNSKPGQSVVYDEGFTGLNSKGTMSQVNRTIVQMLAEIRQKNLFIFIVMPTFFDLDRYPCLWRSRALLHVYTAEQFQRGFFSFYNTDRKKELYVLGKKLYSYRMPKPNFYGKFTNAYVVDEAAYRKKKRDSIDKSLRDANKMGLREEKLLRAYKDRFQAAMVILKKLYPERKIVDLMEAQGIILTRERINQVSNGKYNI